MAQQTINVGTAPNDGTGTPLRTAFQYTNSNFSELYTALGGGSGLPGASTQVLFNNGTNIAGDAGLVYNSTTDALTIGGNVQAASATITGDLTVDTSTLKVDSANDRVGIGTASPAQFVHLSKSNTSTALTAPPVGGASLRIQNTSSTNNNFGSVEFYNAAGLFGGSVNCQFTNQATPTNDLVFVTRGSSGGLEHYRIAADGVCTWSEVGGVAGTAMTLNSTGLGVGGGAAARIHAIDSSGVCGLFTRAAAPAAALSAAYITAPVSSGFSNSPVYAFWYQNTGISNPANECFAIRTSSTDRLYVDSSGNVGIGVTPSAWRSTNKALQVGSYSSLTSSSAGDLQLFNNAYINSGGANIYQSNGFATRYEQYQGVHAWYTAPSGTAGNSITFTQAMTLDASGRLLVGKTTGVNSIETVGAGVDGRATVSGVSTVATTIYTIKQSATAAMCVVFGDDGLNGFCDIVLFLATVAPKVVSSQTLYGSPAARTYSTSTTNLQLALASGTLSIRTAALSTLNT